MDGPLNASVPRVQEHRSPVQIDYFDKFKGVLKGYTLHVCYFAQQYCYNLYFMADIHRTRSRQMILETNSNKLPELSFGVWKNKCSAGCDSVKCRHDLRWKTSPACGRCPGLSFFEQTCAGTWEGRGGCRGAWCRGWPGGRRRWRWEHLEGGLREGPSRRLSL